MIEVVADRFDRKKVMLISDSLSLCSTIALAFVASFSSLTVWHIFISALWGSMCGVFQAPGGYSKCIGITYASF